MRQVLQVTLVLSRTQKSPNVRAEGTESRSAMPRARLDHAYRLSVARKGVALRHTVLVDVNIVPTMWPC